jgi:hypothetical protein
MKVVGWEGFEEEEGEGEGEEGEERRFEEGSAKGNGFWLTYFSPLSMSCSIDLMMMSFV